MTKTTASLFVYFFACFVLILFQPAWGNAEEGLSSDTREELRKLKQQVQELSDTIEHEDRHMLHKAETQDLAHLLNGMELGLGLTGIVQGSSRAYDIAGEDRTDASGSLDLEVQTKIGERGTAFLLVESRDGAGLTDEIETLHGINADAVDEEGRLRLTEAWYEHTFMDERLLLALGKMDLTSYFDTNAAANDETLQFMADGFVNNMAVEFPEDNGPGMRLTYRLNQTMELGLGLGDSNADFEEIESGLFTILELGIQSQFNHLNGNYRFTLWQNRSDHAEWSNPLRDREENWGMGLSLDQALNQKTTVFFRGGFQDEDVSQVDYALSLGGEIRGPFLQRDKDILGLALGYAHLSRDYKKSAAPLDTDHEQMLEIYYTFHVNDHLLVTPDIQVIRNPSGSGDADTITLFGLRAQVFL